MLLDQCKLADNMGEGGSVSGIKGDLALDLQTPLLVCGLTSVCCYSHIDSRASFESDSSELCKTRVASSTAVVSLIRNVVLLIVK